MANDRFIDYLLRNDGVVLAQEHPALRNALFRATQAGRLARLLPGVYTDAGRRQDLPTRMAAISRWDPSAVICGRAAAAATYWPEIPVGPVEVASPVRHRPQSGYEFSQRRIPPELVQIHRGVSLTSPSLTAMELATWEFTDPIDIALRKRVVTLRSLRNALDQTPHRRGHTDRRQVLLDSRQEPWSAAERLAHRIYRGAGIAGWVANHEVDIPDAGTYFLDIAFRRQRVASEIDGQIHERDRVIFESDRVRQNAVVLEGWTILRFTWELLTSDPSYVISTTKRALAESEKNMRLRSRQQRKCQCRAG